jgi:hypothetical protein
MQTNGDSWGYQLQQRRLPARARHNGELPLGLLGGGSTFTNSVPGLGQPIGETRVRSAVAPVSQVSGWQRGARVVNPPEFGLQNVPLPGEPVSEGRLTGRQTGPVLFIVRLLEDWRLQDVDAGKLLGFEEADAPHVRSILAGHLSLRGRDIKDRVALLLQIRASLHTLFRSLETENEWLRESQDVLDGQSPLEALLEGSMLSVLAVKDLVDFMSGR